MPTPPAPFARTAFAALALVLATPVQAAIVQGSFAGTLIDGTDSSGVFGPSGADLTGMPLVGSYTYDTTLLAPMLGGTVTTGTGSPGALSVMITIGGQSFTFTDPTGSSVALDSSTGELDLTLLNAAGSDYEAFSLDAVPASTSIAGMSLSQSFADGTLDTSLGSFVIADATSQATGDFTLTSITQTSGTATAVPEPTSFALIAPALAALAVARKRRQATDK